ncbi:MAG TPA: DALR domain-containing protein, partial [Actinomycetota bacterium]|nr:DALR domain-containing protein [Actinomycetota bacterium]
KSLGNFVLVKDIRQHRSGESLRYWGLMGSYRSQPSFSEESLDDASQSYERWRTFHQATSHLLGLAEKVEATRPLDEAIDDPYVGRFTDALDDDLNSAGAFAVVHEIVREGNRLLEDAQRGDEEARSSLEGLRRVFLELTHVLGFAFDQGEADSELVAGLVEYLLDLRTQARAEKAFDRADEIRARLQELGVAIEDTPAGTRWRLGGASP